MVRSKNLAVSFGRKQRIEGIVKNLSNKVRSEGVNSLFNGFQQESSEPLSLSSQQRTERRSSTVNDLTKSVYQLPSELEFSGVVSSQYLSKGKQFGPFVGTITSLLEQPGFNHSLVCQIPDFDGNSYSLCLFTQELESYKWLKCIKSYTRGSYNVVAYNTPNGVMLQTVSDVAVGDELCIAYDLSYNTIEMKLDGDDVVCIGTKVVTAEQPVENVNMREPVFASDDRSDSTYSVNVTEGQSMLDKRDTADDLPRPSEPTYSVMTADVTEDLNPTKEEEEPLHEEIKEAKPTKIPKKSGQKGKQGASKLYRCHSCKKQFETLEQKQQHLDTNHTTDCPVCNKTYSRAYLKEHMLYHLESSRVTCPICSKIFSSISNLRKHQKKHSRRPVSAAAVADKVSLFKCSECPKAFKSEKYLETHRKKHVRVIPISCDECDQVFTSKSLLRRHNAVTHQGKKPFSCKHCHKTFTQSGNLSRHCRQAHSEDKEIRDRAAKEKFLCRRRGCDQKAFTSRDLFIKHLEQHSGSRGVFPCGECNSVFSSSSNLSKHRKSQHKGKIKTEVKVKQGVTYLCELCNTDFQNEALYYKHLRYHKISKGENKCQLCGKEFATRSGLFKHVRLLRCSVTKKMKFSKPEKTFDCPDCNKTFLSASDLRIHRRSHSIVNAFVCEICGKAFNQLGNLGKHKRHVHQGIPRPKEKPRPKKLTCNICNKTLSTAAFDLHARLHVGIKPSVKCEYCGTGYTPSGLKKHIPHCKKLSDVVIPAVDGDHPIVVPSTSQVPEHIPMPSVRTFMDGRWRGNGDDSLVRMDDEMEEPGSPVF